MQAFAVVPSGAAARHSAVRQGVAACASRCAIAPRQESPPKPGSSQCPPARVPPSPRRAPALRAGRRFRSSTATSPRSARPVPAPPVALATRRHRLPSTGRRGSAIPNHRNGRIRRHSCVLQRKSFLHTVGQPLPNAIEEQPRSLSATPQLLSDGRQREFLHEAPLDDFLLVGTELFQTLPQGCEPTVVVVRLGVERGEFQLRALLLQEAARQPRLALVTPRLVSAM